MNRCILVLTKSYPFLGGESFLDLEIQYLYKSFDKVIIIPTEVSKCKLEFDVPDDVDIEKLSIFGNKIMSKLVYIMLSFVFPKSKMYRAEKKIKANTLFKRLFFRYYDTKVNILSQKIIKKLEKYNLNKFGEIIIYSYWFFDLANIGLNLKKHYKIKNVKLISRAHGYDLYEERNPNIFYPYREIIFNNVDCVYCCSQNGADYLRRQYSSYKHKIDVSLLGTKDYGLGSGKPLPTTFSILSCSRIDKNKRVERIAHALAAMIDIPYSIKWYHIGDGKDRKRLESWCRANIKNVSVNFMGQLTNAEVLNFYSNTYINVFINVSEYEGLPVSIMEAMSFGIPVIATDVGGVNEIVLDNATGSLLKKDFSDEELIRVIKLYIFMNQKRDETIRDTCREHWKSNFHNETNYLRFIMKIVNL